MCVFLISPVPITEPLTSELIDTPVFYNLAPRLIKYRVSVPIPRLGSRHQEPPHTDVSRNLATVVIRDVLPGLKRWRTGLLPSGPKSFFQMRASFVFHLETKVLESGGRVEKLIAQVAWSSVLSFHSLWWFGMQCHLLVLVHCVFWKPPSLHLFTNKFWSSSCFLLLTCFLKRLISFSSRIWHLPTLPKAPKVG